MQININSPAYYSQEFFIDDEVYRMCQETYLHFQNKEYSAVLHIIGIVPIVVPEELYADGKWKEGIRFLSNKSGVVIYIKIDFDQYHNSDSEGRKNLMKDAVLRAVKKVKTKGKFDYNTFEKDITQFWNGN